MWKNIKTSRDTVPLNVSFYLPQLMASSSNLLARAVADSFSVERDSIFFLMESMLKLLLLTLKLLLVLKLVEQL
jgi:hypothetical protein